MSDHRDESPDAPDEEFAALSSLLASGSVWAAADPTIEDRVVDEITAEVRDRPRAPSAPGLEDRYRLRIIATVAAVFLATAITVGLLAAGDDDTDSFALAGTELAIDATAEATVDETDSGLRVLLDVRDLAPAGEGRYYQAWVRSEAGEAVTIGTFHMNGGDAEIELWAGVTAEDYPIITVTIQEEGAGAESSGMVVLRGSAGG